MIYEKWANNSELLQFYVARMHNLPKIIKFFVISGNLQKTCMTNFVPSRFWWQADFVFYGMKHIFIQIFVQVNAHDDCNV